MENVYPHVSLSGAGVFFFLTLLAALGAWYSYGTALKWENGKCTGIDWHTIKRTINVGPIALGTVVLSIGLCVFLGHFMVTHWQ